MNNMENRMKNHPIILYPADEGGFVAEIPALPGCIAQGETMLECLEELNTVKALWIETAKKHKQKLPNVEAAYRKVRSLSVPDQPSMEVVRLRNEEDNTYDRSLV